MKVGQTKFEDPVARRILSFAFLSVVNSEGRKVEARMIATTNVEALAIAAYCILQNHRPSVDFKSEAQAQASFRRNFSIIQSSKNALDDQHDDFWWQLLIASRKTSLFKSIV